MRSRILAGFLAVAMSVVSFAPALAAGGTNGNLNGTVIDASSKAPIAGASVVARSGSGTYSATTDARGFFSILQMNVDSYTVAITASGHDTVNLPNVIVFGDETDSVGTVAMNPSNLKTIAKVTSRSVNSAYQPTQTVDTYSVSGQRVQQALGNQYSTNEAQLIQSAPGVIPVFDMGGTGISIRGSLAVELGYQYDEVPFSAPFFNENASQGFINGINGGSGGGLQIVSGAGDATQGNQGAGIINTIVPRGTYPAYADADFEVGGPYYNHTINADWATASPNGRWSNYMSFSATSSVPQGIPYNADSSQYGDYFGTSFQRHNDFVDNAVFRFGKNNSQSFQILARMTFLSSFTGYGGLNGLQYFNNSNSLFLSNWSGFFGGSNAYFASLIPTLPYAPANPNAPVTQGENTNNNPLHFLKFAYSNSINPTTFLSVSAYNWGLLEGGTNYTNYPSSGDFGIGWGVIGGSRTGVIAQVTHQFGENNTLTFEGKLENAHPYWDAQQPGSSAFALSFAELGIFGGPESPNASDWAQPANASAVSGAGNPCPIAGGCYIHDALVAAGKWNGTEPDYPLFGINYHNTDQLQFGVGLRDQWQIGDKLNLDWGVREDTEDNKFGPTPFNGPDGNPSDVGSSKLPNAFVKPTAIEPRFAFSYRVTKNDSVRFSYARSVQFFFGQTLGTPFNVSGINPLLLAIPAKSDHRATGGANDPYCGSGWADPGNGYTNQPWYTGSGTGNLFPCQNYAASVAWLYDQNLDAPDLGGFGPPTYNNFDLAWSHLFTKGALRGWSSRLTAYTRRGFNVEQNVLLLNGPPNPITGQSSASVFTTTPNGNEKTFGIEAYLTTPDVPKGESGLSGFVTFDYINELLNTPPVAGSSNLPILPGQLLATGAMFKAGFVPPVSAVIGATYHFKDGITVTPTMFMNGGYPFGNGRSTIGYLNGVLGWNPQTNYGAPNLPFTGASGPGNAYNSSYYVDPQVPGSISNPNIAGSRGYAEPALAGLKNTPAQFFMNLDVEAPLSKQVTVGFQVFNVFDQKYSVPTPNTVYQPVGFGIAGPQSGTFATANPLNGIPGAGNEALAEGGQLPYLNGYNVGTTWNVYFRTRL